MILIEKEGENVWDFTQDELIGLSKLNDRTAKRWESQGQCQDFKCGVLEEKDSIGGSRYC